MKAYVLNEITLVSVIIRRLRRQPTVILMVDAFLPPLNGVLKRICERLTVAESHRKIQDVVPERHPEWDHAAPLLENMYEILEPEIERAFDFENLSVLPAPYAFASRHAATMYVSTRLGLLLAVRECFDRGIISQSHIYGLPFGIRQLAAAATGRPTLYRGSTVLSACRLVVTSAMTLMGAVYCIAWVVKRLTFRPVVRERIDFAFDYISDNSDDWICREIRAHKSVMLVGRKYRPDPEKLPADFNTIPCGAIGGSNVSARDALRVYAEMLAEMARIWRHGRFCDVPLFASLISLVFKNSDYRGFFERYAVDVFWGRDQYNPEHVLRHHHLKKTGGSSWGVLQGCPSYAPLYPQFRYLSMDRYYVMVPSLFEGRVRRHWPGSMQVVGVDTFCATREEHRWRFKERPNDISFMSSIWTGRPEFAAAIGHVARVFADRKIYVQIKPSFAQTTVGRKFAMQVAALAPNIEVSTALVYELICKTRFTISDPSTLVLEAVQFGNYSFMFDIPDAQEIAFHREIEGFCVTSGEEIETRICGLEDGYASYPIEHLGALIRLDGEPFVDTVRRDTGIGPLEPSKQVWKLDPSVPGVLPSIISAES